MLPLTLQSCDVGPSVVPSSGKDQRDAVDGHAHPTAHRAEAVIQRHRQTDTSVRLQERKSGHTKKLQNCRLQLHWMKVVQHNKLLVEIHDMRQHVSNFVVFGSVSTWQRPPDLTSLPEAVAAQSLKTNLPKTAELCSFQFLKQERIVTISGTIFSWGVIFVSVCRNDRTQCNKWINKEEWTQPWRLWWKLLSRAWSQKKFDFWE